MTEREQLKKFRDLKITKEELYNIIPSEKRNSPIDRPVEVCSSHMIDLLEKYKSGLISDKALLEWVNTIWFSGWFDYCDEHCDSIASVMNELEEIDEIGKELTAEKIEIYITALRNNEEI